MFGSREVVVGHYFRTLAIMEASLEKARQRNFTINLERLRDVWRLTLESLTSESPATVPLDAGPCAVATAQSDIIRSAGPPVRRFFLQDSETGPDFRHLCSKMASLEDCVHAQERFWALPFAAVSGCVGLDYDLTLGWNSTCKASDLEDDMRRAHARSFGKSLVGDLEGWAKNRMSTTLWHDHYREAVRHPGTRTPDGFS